MTLYSLSQSQFYSAILKDPFGDVIKGIMDEIHQHAELKPLCQPGTQYYEQWVVQKEQNGERNVICTALRVELSLTLVQKTGYISTQYIQLVCGGNYVIEYFSPMTVTNKSDCSSTVALCSTALTHYCIVGLLSCMLQEVNSAPSH